ncbi:MAG: S-layer homology domain-containing protein, partial [Candidatus Peregrinibacteria bacterium]|nr:S-layer homology domain-containing protein [Candidatus Peregrinibacteria bacterium]
MPRSNTFAQVQTGGLESANNQLREKVERQVAQTNTTNPEPSSSSSCKADLCLPDPILNKPVPVIPHIDLLPTSKTVFMPSGHLVYTDGSGLYLKRDLTVEETKDNTNSSQPAQFSFGDNFLARLGMEPYPKEAVNMLRSDIIKNEASSFSWRPSTHPAVYGYGIELERVISGYDPDQQNNQMADTRIILLPPTEESAAPEAYADDQLVTYGTLMTSMTDLEEASRRFGVSPKNIVGGISEARFPTINNAKINLNEYRAVYLDQLQGSAYDVEMENGFYQIKMTWFDDQALTATYNQNEILAPQLQADAAEPLDVSQTDIYYAPIFKEKTISASEIFVDLSDSYNYYWFINPDENSITPQVGDSLTLPAQTSEKTIKVKLVATQDLADDSYERFEKIFSIQIYIPSIELDADKLAEGIVAGNMTPIDEAASDNLSGIPFSVFRNRNNTWKNIGILRDEDPDKAATSPPLENPQTYYTIDAAGTYHIEGFDFTEPSSIDLKDQSANLVAQVQPGTGRIDLFDSNYELRAVAAGTTSPTHIAIVHKDSEEILGNVYYVSSAASKIKIVESGLTSNNVTTSGTTVGDLNTGDDFIAANIPDQGPSFPGGVAIFNQTPPQVNVALIDRDGTIRMMQDGYSLQLKNPNDPNGRYIFQIVNSSGRAIFDVFIQANFENLNIDKSTVMNELGGQIGLNPSLDRTFAQLNPTGEKLEVTTTDSENPFPDLNETHPYFKQILELYKARVISGYGDGSFRPDQKLTRAEFVKIALGVTNCYDCTEPTDPQKAKYTANPFPDVSLPAWYFYCISIAKELGMITGYGDGFFRPDRNISRAEAAAVLLRQSGIELSEAPENFFKDVPDYAWYVDYVYTAVEIGLIKESFGFVNPDEEITRGEFAFMAAGLKDYRECRLVDEDGDGLPDWWEMRNNLDPLVADLDQACPCFDNPNQSDSDQDGIRDVCDLDIDNDGILNPICIFDARGQIDQALLETGALTLGEPTDNCIFIANEDQADIDGNAIGNVCEVECACLDNPNKN